MSPDMTPDLIPEAATDAATRAQIHAANPKRSSWVTANAGSGKTRVLTDRVARLLLRGTDPQRILCLTYTRAAAAEMQNRLFARLGTWAMMPDAELRATLAGLGENEQAVEAAQLMQARTLFARALETPGGLKIQTIHSFCDRLLRQFPLEAGVTPNFDTIDDRQARQIRAEILEEMAAGPDQPAFDAMARHISGDDALDGLLGSILAASDRFAPLDEAGLKSRLGVREPFSDQTVIDDLHATGDSRAFDLLADLLISRGGARDKRAGEAIRLMPVAPAEAVQAMSREFLKSDFTIHTHQFPTTAVAQADPGAEAFMRAISLVLHEAHNTRLAARAYARTRDLHLFATRFLALYTARKRALGRLDFSDLIDRTRALLQSSEAAQWVLYRLDGGIDHILVDEAQDTSPEQWQVIEALTSEFFAGEGARAASRTIFVVGDEKQSIYSFQGADPAAFSDMRARYSRALDEVAEGLELCELHFSFRSASPILSVVDETCRQIEGQGIGQSIFHKAHKAALPGRVDLWDFIDKPDTPEEPARHLPVDAPPPDDPSQLLARQVAGEIRRLLDTGTILPHADGPRPVRSGDFLILVQSRGPLFDALIREIKSADIPLAGADRLRLLDELAVRDLLSLLKVLVTPADDLSLAEFLRSPMGGFSEADLFALAYPRKDTLWRALRHRQPEAPATRVLQDLRDRTDYLRPFDLLDRALTRHGLRQALTARLGPECADGIDALLAQALAYERVEAPSLTGFLDWIIADETEIRRRVDDGSDRLRVMTVHGAKGLEAPIVILPQTARRDAPKLSPVIPLPDGGPPVWLPNAKEAPPAIAEAADTARRRLEQERNRLLYVAMTRAENWLIVCGGGARGTSPEDSWYGLAEASMQFLRAHRFELGLRLESGDWSATQEAAHFPTRFPNPSPEPGPVSTPPPSPAPRAPSSLGGAHALAPNTADLTDLDPADSLARGHVLHLLLEILPTHPRADWPDIARRLARVQPGTASVSFSEADLADVLAEATTLLTTPALAWIFAPGTLAEVPVSADLPGLGRIRGSIDRLIVAEDHIQAIDFKSNRVVPRTPGETPEALLRQMGAYSAALAQIWPGRPIRTALLWTRTAQLLQLPQETVQSALSRAAEVDPSGAGP